MIKTRKANQNLQPIVNTTNQHVLLISAFATLLITMFFPHFAAAEELTKGAKDTLFIGETKAADSVYSLASKQGRALELQRAIETLDVEFNNAMNATQVFQLVERKRKSEIEMEQAYAAVAVDPNDKSAAQMNMMAGAKFALLPMIDGFEIRSNSLNYQAIGRTSATRSVFLSAIVQVIDTTTGKILSSSPSIQSETSESVELARMGTTPGSDQAIHTLARELAKKLSQAIVADLRPPKVLAVTGDEVMINRGSEAGFEPGVHVKFFATQDVIDDDTGETFSNEVEVGMAKVSRSDNRKSFAKIEGTDLGITKGCIVKITQPSPIKARSVNLPPKVKEEISPGSSEKPLDL